MSAGLLIGIGLLILALVSMAWVDVRSRPREPRRRRSYDDSGGLTSGSGTDGWDGGGGDSSGF